MSAAVMAEREFLTVPEVAKLFRRRPEWVRRHGAGKHGLDLKGVRVGRLWLFSRAHIYELLRKGGA